MKIGKDWLKGKIDRTMNVCPTDANIMTAVLPSDMESIRTHIPPMK
jgi:hypothetical protein